MMLLLCHILCLEFSGLWFLGRGSKTKRSSVEKHKRVWPVFFDQHIQLICKSVKEGEK